MIVVGFRSGTLLHLKGAHDVGCDVKQFVRSCLGGADWWHVLAYVCCIWLPILASSRLFSSRASAFNSLLILPYKYPDFVKK